MHTVIVDGDYLQKQMTNMINISMRRCRIGKVVQKSKGSWVTPFTPDRKWISPLTPEHNPLTPFFPIERPYSVGRKCHCPPNSSCNNIACPYATYSTC